MSDNNIQKHIEELARQESFNAELKNIKNRSQEIIDNFDAAEQSKMPKWVLEVIQEHFSLERESAKEAGTLGFYAQALAMCVTPYKDPKSYFYKRKNGDFELTFLSSQGIPYGVIPRLLMAWVTTEAVKTKSPVIKIGSSLGDFLKNTLGISKGGGRSGNSTRVREQMIRLFSSHIDAVYKSDKRSFTMKNVSFADEMNINFDELDKLFEKKETTLWVPQRHNAGKWESELVLNKNFYEECTSKPIPIDLRAYKSLTAAPLAMDIYTWITYRMSNLRRECKIPLEALMLQFGAKFKEYENDKTLARRNFRKQFEPALRAVVAVYPELKVALTEAHLILYPSPPHIPRNNQPSLPW